MSKETEEADLKAVKEEVRASTAGRLTATACVSINSTDTLWVVRHYTGSGSVLDEDGPYITRLIEVYVIRSQRYLGRFEIEDKPTFDAKWQPALEHPKPATSKHVAKFREARMAMLTAVAKLWPDP